MWFIRTPAGLSHLKHRCSSEVCALDCHKVCRDQRRRPYNHISALRGPMEASQQASKQQQWAVWFHIFHVPIGPHVSLKMRHLLVPFSNFGFNVQQSGRLCAFRIPRIMP